MCRSINKNIKRSIPYIFLFIVILLLINRFQFIVVRGNSMFPIYLEGDILFAQNTKNINLGDTVVFKNENEQLIKRVVAKNEDIITIESNKLYINNILYSDYKCSSEERTIRLNENEFFVLGDNPFDSYDSRYFGVVHLNDIQFKIICKLFPR